MILLLLGLPVILSLVLFVFKSHTLNRWVPLGYSVFFLVAAAYLAANHTTCGAYFAVDPLNSIFLLVLAVLFFVVSLYNIDYLQLNTIAAQKSTYYSISLLIFSFSMTGALLSYHLGLLWVFIEATTLVTGYLIYFNAQKSSIEAAWKYVFICSIGISLAYVGIIFLSIGTGSINSLFLNDLYREAARIHPLWLKLSFIFIMVGFGSKMGLVPVHTWLPDAHSEAPSPVSALLSGVLLNTAFLAILRVYKLLSLAGLASFGQTFFWIMGGASLLVSAVFMIRVKNYKRLLAYSSIENMGIMTIGIAVGGVGVFAALLHVIAHSLSKAALFLTSGNILVHYHHKKEISQVTGLFKKDSKTAWLWILGFLAIIGIPPSPIFVTEWLIVKSCFQRGFWLLGVLFLAVLAVIIYGFASSVFQMSFSQNKQPDTAHKDIILSPLRYIPQIILLFILVLIGLYIPLFLNNLILQAGVLIE